MYIVIHYILYFENYISVILSVIKYYFKTEVIIYYLMQNDKNFITRVVYSTISFSTITFKQILD